MKTMTPLFNVTVAKKGLKRTMPLWLAHFIIWCFVMPIMVSNVGRMDSDSLGVSNYILSTMSFGGPLMAAGFCGIMSELLSNYMFASRSMGFYHALPVRRTTLFFTNLLTSLGVILVPAAAVALMTHIVAMSNGHNAFPAIAEWFGVYCQYCLFFTGFSLLCCHVTGHVGIGTVLYAILNFAAVALEAAVRYIMSLFLYGLEPLSGGIRLMSLSPLVKIYSTSHVNWGEDHIGGGEYRLILTAAALVLIALAWLLYRVRRSEASGEIISEPVLKPVFKYCFTAGCSIILGVIFYIMSYSIRANGANAIWFTLCMIMGGAIGYFAAEMLLKKSMRVFGKGLKGFAAAAAVIALFGASLALDPLGIVTRVPDPSEVGHIRLAGPYSYDAGILEGEAALETVRELHQYIVDNRKELEPVDSNESAYTSTRRIELDYTLKNGSTLSRSYTVPVSYYDKRTEKDEILPAGELLEKIFKEPEVIKRGFPALWEKSGSATLTMAESWDGENHDYHTLKSEAWSELLEALREELLEGKIGVDSYYSTSDDPAYRLDLQFSVRNGKDADWYSYGFNVNPDAPLTYAILSDPANYAEDGADYGYVEDPEAVGVGIEIAPDPA